jgi:hypothetical protein
MKVTLKSKTKNPSADSERLYKRPISEQETELRRRTTTKTTALLMSLHTFRIAGLFIFVIYGLSEGVLPATFAYSAGVGDFLIAIAAIPLAYLLIRRVRFSRGLAIVWNGFGLLDFCFSIYIRNRSQSGSYHALISLGYHTCRLGTNICDNTWNNIVPFNTQ